MLLCIGVPTAVCSIRRPSCTHSALMTPGLTQASGSVACRPSLLNCHLPRSLTGIEDWEGPTDTWSMAGEGVVHL